jgi:cellulose synthase/poly-beta-1,6-N-acetylglucosamine synthase-like glycosyltransferase
MTLIRIILEAVALFLLIPVSVLFAEILLAVTKPAQNRPEPGQRKPLAILVPAHDESSLIATTIHSLIPQLNASDRLVVVADNCSDDTAAIARAGGAETIIRADLMHRGKGFALDFGTRHLALDPPEIVIIIDADCRVAPGAIDRLARMCTRTGRPIQASYLMHARSDAGLTMRIAAFAWIVKNQARAEGLQRLGLPCQLMGTGMAFPWSCISGATLATGHIVEDLKLGIDLARAGTAPLFCPDALVSSEFPASRAGVRSQRTRWEHGHLAVILREVPRMLLNSLATKDIGLLAMTLDLGVPPLALLTLLVSAVWCACGIFFIFAHEISPLVIATSAAILLALSVVMAWVRYGRRVISFGSLAMAIPYALWKIPLYAKFLVARQMDWVRSKRNEDDPH